MALLLCYRELLRALTTPRKERTFHHQRRTDHQHQSQRSNADAKLRKREPQRWPRRRNTTTKMEKERLARSTVRKASSRSMGKNTAKRRVKMETKTSTVSSRIMARSMARKESNKSSTELQWLRSPRQFTKVVYRGSLGQMVVSC